ncbi:MAG: hypothetical protein IJA75_08760 [Oscillospiraceae bacterium]|nr:hypothetical protein [Oscillospiraceae bacterium]
MAFSEWLREYRQTQNPNSKGTSKQAAPSGTGSSASEGGGSSFKDSLKIYREKQTGESLQGWGNATSALLRDTENYFQTWSSREDAQYKSLSDRSDQLLVQAGDWRRQYAGNQEAMDYIDLVVKTLSEAKQSYKSYFDYYSQWGSEEEYNAYQAWKRDYDEKMGLDLHSYEQQLARLLQERQESGKVVPGSAGYLTGTGTVSSAPYGAARSMPTADEARDIALAQEISERQRYLNQARYLQDKAKLAAVTGSADFDAYSADSRGTESLLQRWEQKKAVPGQSGYLSGGANAPAAPYAAARQDTAAPSYSLYNEADYMTGEEAAVYNYYYAKYGKEKAEEYLYSIREELNRRVAAERFAGIEGKTARELGFGVAAGLDQFVSGVVNLGESLTEDKRYIPLSPTQMVSGMVREDLSDAGPNLPEWMGGASLGQAGYDLITTTANMAPSILASMAVSLVNPAAGVAVGNGLMGASAAGGAYQEALNEGYSPDQARGYGLLVGASEIALEKVLGGISALGGNALGKTAIKNLDNASAALKRVARVAGGAVSEFSEEYLQEILTPLFRNIALGTGEEVKLFSEEALYSGILGALSGGTMETVGIAADAGAENRYYKDTYGGSAAELVQEGLESPEGSPVHALAEKYQDVLKNGGTLTGVQLHQLVEANEQQIATEKVDDLRRKAGEVLAELGETGDVDKLSGILAKQAANQKLTWAEKKVLEESPFAQRAAEELERRSAQETAESGGEATVSKEEKVVSETDNTTVETDAASEAAADARMEGKTEGSTGESSVVQAADEEFRASATGKTQVPGKGTAARIAAVVSTDGVGGMQVKLEDGSTVDAADIEYASEGEAVLYEAVAKLGASADVSNLLIDNYRKNPGGVSPEDYAAGMLEAFTYGRYLFPKDQISQSKAAEALTEMQRNGAYELGRVFGRELIQSKEANIQRARVIAKTNQVKQKAAERNLGRKPKVHFDGKGKMLSAAQETALTQMEQLSVLLGVEFEVFESYISVAGERVYRDENGVEQAAPNGWYDPATGKIHVDLNAGADGKGTMIFTVAHELTHFIRQWSPAKFDRLAEAVFELVYKEKNISIVDLVRKQQTKAARNGMELSFEEAYEEMVADSMEGILTSGNVVELMAEVKQRDVTLWEKLREWFRSLAEDIKKLVRAYQGYKPDSVEGRAVASMKEMLPVIEAFYADALTEASENRQGAEGQKNTTREGGTKYHARNAESFTASEAQAIQNIGRKSIFAFTSADTKATERLAMRHWKEMGNKSPFFRAWFGDWRVSDKTGVQVANIRGDSKGVQKNDDTGWEIRVSGQVFNETRTHNSLISREARPYLPYINDIVRKAVLLDTWSFDQTRIKSENSLLMHSLYAVADIGKGPEVLKLYVEEMNDPNKADTSKRAYHLQNIEKAFNASVRVQGNAPSSLTNTPNAIRTVADLFAAVKQYDNDFVPNSPSKVVDADGKPRVMYHGSKAQFEVFDKTKAKSSGLYGKGFYFTDSDSHAGTYGNLYSVYLNIKNPLQRGSGTVNRQQVQKYLRAVAENEDYSIENYGTYDINEVLKKVIGKQKNVDAFQIIQDINATAIGNMVEAVELFNAVNGTTYDGIVVPTETVAFYPEQIKSATDNVGTFDGKNPSIKHSLRDPLQEKALKALEKENVQLKEDVSRLRELVKLQGKVTNGTRFKHSSVEAAAKYLKKLFHTGGDTRELTGKLKDFYEYMAAEPELTLQTVQEHSVPIVEWLQEHEKFRRSQYAQEVLDTLKGQSFRLDETQLQEVRSHYGNLNSYRHAVKNMVSNKAGQSLDQLWQELSSQYPDIFRADTNANDMPLMFADALDILENMEDTETAADWMMKDQTMLEELLDSFWRVDRLETVADRYEKKINELRGKHEQQMKQLRRNRDTALAELRADKKAAEETVRDNRDRAVIRGKIRKIVKKLDTLLKSETKEKHVPDRMKKAVADALSLMNELDMGVAERRIEAARTAVQALEQKLAQAEGFADSSLIADIQAEMDEKRLILQRYEKSGSRLTALKDAYAEIQKSADPDIAAGYDAEVAGALTELADSLKDTSFRDMSREQLQDVLDMYTMVLTRIRDANKQLGARRGETLRENAAETEADIRKFGIIEEDPGVLADKLTKFVRGISWNNLRPVDAFHRLGSRKLEQLYMDLVDGMAQRGRQIKEIGQFITDIRKKTGYRGFDLKEAETYTTVDGRKMKLTLAEKMSIYAYSKREQAFDHMAEGGFTYAKDLTYKEKGKTKVHTGKAETWRLSMDDLQAICGSLTEQQRQYVDGVQQFLTEFGKHGDKVNMELYGIKLFNKENAYFPLRSDRDYRKSVENQLGGTMTAASLKNDGMTKKTVPGANNPIVLEDFDRVVFTHLDKMVNYANLVLPLENLRRVFDYQTAAGENHAPDSMKALIGATFGREAQQYVEQFLTDANGTRMGMSVNPLETMFTRSKGMAVAANLSVVIQQVSAVVRAGAEISPKHLMWAAESRRGVKLYDEMVEYAPIAIIKDMGGFDTGSNRSIEDYIGFEEAPKSAQKTWNSMQKLFGKGAETMDKVGWCLIWNGVKREVASRKQYKVNSEEFLQECGKRFTEVIVKTQVYDSVLSRSGYMRDKYGTMRYLTSFMGEPTVQAGMVFRSHLDVVRAIRQKKDVRVSIKKLIRTDAALIGALVVNGMLKAIPYAMRDDDEDEGYWERWAKHFGSALSELWKPWELLPILRNIDDILKGYSITQPDMALLEGLLQAGNRVYNVMQDEEKLGEMEPEDWYALAKDLLGALGNFCGVPVENIWRDLEGFARVFKDATDGIDSDGMLLDALWRGMKGEEKTKQEGIYDAMLSGDTARLEALRATYKTESSYQSAVMNVYYAAIRSGNKEGIQIAYNALIEEKKRGHYLEHEAEASAASSVASKVRNEYLDGDISGVDAKSILTKYGGKSEAEAETEIKKLDFQMEYHYAWGSRDRCYRSGTITRDQLVSAVMDIEGASQKKAEEYVDFLELEMENQDVDITASEVSGYFEHAKPAGISSELYLDAYRFYRDSGEEGVSNSKVKECMPYINDLPLTAEQKTALALCWWAESTVEKYKLW